MIPYGRQEITSEDLDIVVEVLKSDFLTQGPVVPAFENAVKDYCRANHAVATNSATSALHIACLSLGVAEGDIVWTSPITFVASANCALYCGAEVDFVDIDPESYNLSVDELKIKLKKAELENRLPKALVAVHMCGQSCDMESIRNLSNKYGFYVIEDASHAIGGKYIGHPVGGCQYSDITIFSFHPVKIITSGEGGMALTNDKKLASKMRLLRSHGVTRDTEKLSRDSVGPWYYEQLDLGFNYRMTDIHAALGLSQLERLDDYVERRHTLADRYDLLLHDLPLQRPKRFNSSYSAFHLYIVRLDLSRITQSYQQIFQTLREKDIGVNLHYIPVHTQPYYQELGFKGGDYPQAEQYYHEALTLPLFPTMSNEQQDCVVDELKSCILS